MDSLIDQCAVGIILPLKEALDHHRIKFFEIPACDLLGVAAE